MGYIVRSAINPKVILCTDGQFHYEGIVGAGTELRAEVYETRGSAEKVRGGYAIIVEERQ